MTHYERVRKFMELAGQWIPGVPSALDPDTRVLRAKLIYEECVKELIGEGLGVTIGVNATDLVDIAARETDLMFTADKPFSLVELADGCADGAVVITGTAIAAGILMDPVQVLVDDNNLAKFGPGGYRSDGTDGRAVGKWVKPPGHPPPAIAAELRRQEEAKNERSEEVPTPRGK